MHNDLFTIGNLTVHGYGLMIAIGILVAENLASRQAKKYDLDVDKIETMALWALFYGFLGSKLTYILLNLQTVIANPTDYFTNGWVVYGGLVGGVLGARFYCKKNKLDVKRYLNLFVPVVPLAQGFGRIGCFLAGCCYGKETCSRFSVVFPQGSLAPAGVPLIPTQLISSAGDFLLFYILFRNFNHGEHPEDTAPLYFVLYSIGRFLVEILRGDLERGFIGHLSTSQFLAIIVGIAGGIWLYRNKQSRKEEVEEKE